MIKTTGVEKHMAVSDGLELVHHLEIIKALFLGQNLFQQLSQFRNIPLAVSRVRRSVGPLFPPA
jgi:hypothetical protein